MAALQFLQQNAQHSRLATETIKLKLQSASDIAIVQEPWINNNKIMGYGPNLCVFRSEDPNPRACIVIKKEINAWLLPHLSSRDCCVVEINLERCRNIIAVSLYMPHDEGLPLSRIDNIFAFKQCRIVISCDANSHHVSWGCTDTNARGTELFDYIMTNDLIVANEGNSCLLYTSPSPRDKRQSRMPSSA